MSIQINNLKLFQDWNSSPKKKLTFFLLLFFCVCKMIFSFFFVLLCIPYLSVRGWKFWVRAKEFIKRLCIWICWFQSKNIPQDYFNKQFIFSIYSFIKILHNRLYEGHFLKFPWCENLSGIYCALTIIDTFSGRTANFPRKVF